MSFSQNGQRGSINGHPDPQAICVNINLILIFFFWGGNVIAKIFKIAPESIRRQRRIDIWNTALALVAIWGLALILHLDMPEGGWRIIAYGVALSAIVIFLRVRWSRQITDEMKHHSIELADDHLILYERGRETRIAYSEIEKAIFRGHTSDVKAIKLIAGDWLKLDLPLYEDFQTMARTLRAKLPPAITVER